MKRTPTSPRSHQACSGSTGAPPTTRKSEFLVLGVFADNHQRFGEVYKTTTPNAAEELARTAAREAGLELIVAGVVQHGQVVA